MRFTTLIFVCLIISLNLINAQTYWIPKTPILDTLFQINGSVSEISTNDNISFLPVLVNNKFRYQNLVKTNDGLYILIEGTGQVYKAMDTTKTSISFTRLDSTLYSGYNFGAINFSYNDTLFSFGGNGFWITNGHLRYFVKGEGWELVELKNIHPTSRYLYAYLPQESKLQYIQYIVYNKFANYKEENYGTIELDLKTKQMKQLGKLNPKLINGKFGLVHINSPKLGGTIVDYQGEIYLYKFTDNTIYKFKNRLNNDKFLLDKTEGNNIIFEFNDIIYRTRVSDGNVQKFSLTMDDFEKSNEHLYIESFNKQMIYWAIVILTLCLMVITFYFSRRKNRFIKARNSLVQDNSTNQGEFNDFEISVINKIIAKSKENELYTVEELNNSLGLGKKSIEIQKKVRTESINRLNHKFKILFNSESDLIERIRSEEDRRYYIYFINNKNANLFKTKFK